MVLLEILVKREEPKQHFLTKDRCVEKDNAHRKDNVHKNWDTILSNTPIIFQIVAFISLIIYLKRAISTREK